MNLFVLPSWYPSAVQPMAGLFVRDQVAALAGSQPGWNIVVGEWGGHSGALSLRKPGASMRALRWRAAARAGWREPSATEPWHTATTPRLSWTIDWARGGARGLLAASARNLQAAEKRFGRIDLIHAHVGFPAGWIASRLAAERGTPYVLTEHMSPFPVPQLLHRGRPVAALRQAYEGAAAVVAVSPALAMRIRAQGLPCSDVVANVVDDSRFSATPARQAPPFVWLTLGALKAQKGVDVLLRAFAAAAFAPGPAELHIGGDGPERAALQALAAELKLTSQVHWLGAVTPATVPALMARCNAFVLASRHETFGVVLAEALMSGRPVVATRCGGPESFIDDSNGVLVAPDDVAALAGALREMVGVAPRFDPATLRAAAVRRFSRAAVASELVALYGRVKSGVAAETPQ